ncbi:victoriocin [Boeremia exigua]|uniref:victoriocin n=1 Tax=Boeremia exigua TaxID=749465 RepID=UPI001E8EA118|nr:victoriocin [Boeremia exigua]KAH6616271.1 victoriocin [Boeremia exigua]
MKFSLALLSLVATKALCSPTAQSADLAAIENSDVHPAELGIYSPLYDPTQDEANLTSSAGQGELLTEVAKIAARGTCSSGGRGGGTDYDYGCDKGWCWRNCGGPFYDVFDKGKSWCWLKYESGNGGWTPCGRWQDCEWSYNNKQAYCAKGDCPSCGCGC